MTARPDAELLLDHLERRLGEMEAATRAEGAGRLGTVDILRFADAPVEGAVTFTTFGLSRAELHLAPDRHIRMELLLSLRSAPDHSAMAHASLVMLARHLADTSVAPRMAEAHRVGPLAEGSPLEGFALTKPVWFDDGFALLQAGDADVAIAVAQLIPLSSVEAGFVTTHGWDAFVGVIRRQDPDFLDLHRPELLRVEAAPGSSGERYLQPDGTPAP